MTCTFSSVTRPRCIIPSSTVEERLNLFGQIHDLDDHRRVGGKLEDFCGVHAAGLSEAERAAQHGGAGEMQLAGFHHDGFVKRLVAVAVGVTDENAQQRGIERPIRFLLGGLVGSHGG